MSWFLRLYHNILMTLQYVCVIDELNWSVPSMEVLFRNFSQNSCCHWAIYLFRFKWLKNYVQCRMLGTEEFGFSVMSITYYVDWIASKLACHKLSSSCHWLDGAENKFNCKTKNWFWFWFWIYRLIIEASKWTLSTKSQWVNRTINVDCFNGFLTAFIGKSNKIKHFEN